MAGTHSAKAASAAKAGNMAHVESLATPRPKHVLFRQGFEGHALAFLDGSIAVASCEGG